MFTTGVIVVGAAVLAVLVAIVGIFNFISRNYIKVAPNEVVVFYGRKYKAENGQEIGFKVVTGGAKMKIPIIENVSRLSLNVMSIDLQVENAPNKDGVPVTLKGVANVKILSDEASLMAACERFLNMTTGEVQKLAFKNLEGHLRSIAGKMTIEELVGDRTKLNQEVLNDAAADLKKLGLGIDLLTIQEVTDRTGYIEQLGKKRTAEVVRDAQIGSAEAERDSKIKTSAANREGIEAANSNEIAIAESSRDRDIKKANFAATVAKEQATADQAGPLATAQALQGVVEAEQDVEIKKTTKRQQLADAEAVRKEKELVGTVIKPAEAEKLAKIARAEGDKQAIELASEAEKTKKSNEGKGTAEANQALAEAEAAGNKAKLLAEAEGIKAKLLAEAEGIEKKAEAYAKLDEAGKFLLILEAVERIAPAVVREFAGVMAAAAKPFESIDSIQIIDFGGNGAKGGSALANFGQVAPEMMMKLLAAAGSAGIDVSGLLEKAGIDATKFIGAKKEEQTTVETTATEVVDDKKS